MKKNNINTKAVTKLTAAILSVLTAVTLPITALAAVEEDAIETQTAIVETVILDDPEDVRTEAWNEETDEEPEFNAPEDPHETPAPEAPVDEFAPVADPDAKVAALYLCGSHSVDGCIFGHTWIYIENLSDQVLTIGKKTLNPGMGMSVGLHSKRVGGGDHGGVYYDSETSVLAGNDAKQAATLKKEALITLDQLANVTREILSGKWDSYEMFTHNCTNFASAIWDAATGDHTFGFCFPFVLMLQMLLRGATRGLQMQSCAAASM